MTIVKVKSRGLVARLGALRSRHERLENAIDEERKRPMACAFKLQSLKRLKLKVKDEIAALKAQSARKSMA